jgi:hypothetical protein
LAGVAAVPVTDRVSTVNAVALLVVGLMTLIMMYRLMFGLDGSDQLIAILSLACGASVFVNTTASREAFCWFATLMVSVSYTTAGLTKLLSPTWRQGKAFGLIMQTEVYGNPRFSGLLDGRLGRLVSRAIIPLELSFVAVFMGWPMVTAAILTSLALFHVASSIVMGLNCFLPTYICTYGCVWWCSQQLW